MAKLTGKKKAEFLKRMERGRKKARRNNPRREGAAKRKTAKKAAKPAAKKKTAKRNATKGRKLTGAKKAEFLKRMARGRKTAAKRKPAKKATRRTNPKRRRNSETGAEQMYETFHGKAPGRIVEYDELVRFPQHFAELGRLKELRIDLDSANRKFPLTGFGDCLVVCTPDGANLYFVGGDQSIDLAALDIGSDKDFIELGPCVYICYHTTKAFHDFAPVDYFHHFGEEDGIRPMLAYDRLNKGLFLMGGNYQVKREGIVN